MVREKPLAIYSPLIPSFRSSLLCGLTLQNKTSVCSEEGKMFPESNTVSHWRCYRQCLKGLPPPSKWHCFNLFSDTHLLFSYKSTELRYGTLVPSPFRGCKPRARRNDFGLHETKKIAMDLYRFVREHNLLGTKILLLLIRSDGVVSDEPSERILCTLFERFEMSSHCTCLVSRNIPGNIQIYSKTRQPAHCDKRMWALQNCV